MQETWRPRETTSILPLESGKSSEHTENRQLLTIGAVLIVSLTIDEIM